MNPGTLVLVGVLCTPSAPPLAQDAGTAATEEVHDALRELRDRLVKALEARDLEPILASVTDDVVFTGLDGKTARGKAALSAYFERMLTGPDPVVKSLDIDLEADDLTSLYDGDTGIATGRSRDRYVLTDGLEFEIDCRWTCALVKQDDAWLVAAFHSSTDAFDNPILRRAGSALWWGGGIALVVGGLIGFLVGRKSHAA